MSRVLVFGGAGFLGRHVARALADEATLILPRRAECDLVEASLPELTDLVRRARPSAVVNCTGRLDGTELEFVRAHPLVTAKLIEALRSAAPTARLVRIGSAGEYGPTPVGRSVREDDPVDPVGGYGLSHLTATRLVELAVTAGLLDGVVLRVFNPIGPGLPEQSVLGRAARLLRGALARGEAGIALGSLDAHRDLVDVRDVALAVRAAVRRPALPAVVFNVGSGRAVRIRDAVRMLATAAGFSGVVTEAAPAPGAARTAAVPWICADVSRAAGGLGWAPSYDLTDTVKAIWSEVGDLAHVPLPKE
ncbi:NAD-dependent epimerase/dehydratase family protein [Micromonospora mirobrigensis]|uniref:Nucleoside-diphosphate-sugar epimerase n=1 Tax=Micromonospora mirobrigensis TaxID=262898 RepID=A0A1C4Z8T2_9ACTN|nr:NAD(P)-dependent oxidoreductase [Micromonospora mirobrigensis]SCF29365.1 Nucleoside-diphosphate-sugar epimerase [Micromonospora mirobrigensis]